uniref:Alpha-carbonic anhydrase domain-containing protein n=1 Tax=Caenorhabditis japonica TaxID=281687 RepID=A0A8R1HQ63_CAEJA
MAAAQRQSPIDIIGQHVFCDDETCKADALNIEYKSGDCCDVIVNEGGFRVNVKRHCGTFLTANHLPNAKFELAQFHAHWGCNSKEGSEHLLNGKQLSGEVHFVFWNTNYMSFNEAVEKPDGLAVVGVFLKEGKYNDNYHGLIDTVRKATGNTTPISMPKDFALEQLLPTTDKRDFVTYLGSLTTPPFNECVIWTLFTEPVEVSYGQLNVLRNIIPANHRVCQDRCGREIRSSYDFN